MIQWYKDCLSYFRIWYKKGVFIIIYLWFYRFPIEVTPKIAFPIYSGYTSIGTQNWRGECSKGHLFELICESFVEGLILEECLNLIFLP